MKLSIIIVNWNTKKLVLDCVKSIEKYHPSFSYEIIVVDNGSTDGSVEALAKLKKINLIKNTSNLGFTKANNQGISASKGENVLLLNSDTIVKKNSIDELVNFAETHPDAGVVGSKLLNADGSLQPSCFNEPTIGRAIMEFWFGQKGKLAKFAPKGDSPTTVDILIMASFLIPQRTLKKVGFLNENYFMYFEDLDYCRKVRKQGLKVYYIPSSEVVHLHGQSGKKITDAGNQWRRMIPSSKIYHGVLKHYIIFFITWSGQKFLKN